MRAHRSVRMRRNSDRRKLYSHVHERELDLGKEFAELRETEGLESDGEELDWLTEDSGEEESERNEEESAEAELETPKRGAKKSSLHGVPTTDIFMHGLQEEEAEGDHSCREGEGPPAALPDPEGSTTDTVLSPAGNYAEGIVARGDLAPPAGEPPT